jgi:hypothetical protein
MSLREIKREIPNLSVGERLELMDAIVRSLQREFRPKRDRHGAAAALLGLGKTDAPPPTDAEIETILEERLVEKYLK